MNTRFPLRLLRGLMLVALGFGGLHLFAAAAVAAGPCLDTVATLPVLQGNFLFELVADRARMIQVSLVFVALGCALVWWYR